MDDTMYLSSRYAIYGNVSGGGGGAAGAPSPSGRSEVTPLSPSGLCDKPPYISRRL